MPVESPLWHLLQVSDVLDIEFATALSESVPVIAWEPKRSFAPWIAAKSPERRLPDSTLRIRQFPLLRGYARFPFSSIANIGPSLAARLANDSADPSHSPLVCTVPYFAPVAELWKGPVVYWLTDLIAEYSSSKGLDVRSLDRRMCRAATLVCPNSERLATYLIEEAGCHPSKVQIVPNATRGMNVLPGIPKGAAELPPDIYHLPRPLAGVIGNLAGNMDWLLLQRLVEATPHLSWVFVGPTTMAISDRRHRLARKVVMQHQRTHFIGPRPYGDLAHYARAFDVAVLPYLRCEPTYSGSSTRFYEHLVACRPILATRGLEELSRKVPLLQLVDTAEQAIVALEQLRLSGFDDGFTEARWNASRHATWQTRAATVREALSSRLLPGDGPGIGMNQPEAALASG